MFYVQDLKLRALHEKNLENDPQDSEKPYVIRCFRTQAMVFTKQGPMRAEPGTCLVKTPEFSERISVPKKGSEAVISDWLYLHSNMEFKSNLNQLEIPVNTLIFGNREDLLERDIKRILDEKRKELPYYERAIHIQVEALLIKLARAAKQSQIASYERKYESELISLRSYIYDHLEEPWSLEMMAQRLNISQSRFSIVYKQFFQTSPVKDLNRMRIEKAKVLLLSTPMKMEEIAQISGFKNEYYFSKVFKKMEGIPPGKYRNEG